MGKKYKNTDTINLGGLKGSVELFDAGKPWFCLDADYRMIDFNDSFSQRFDIGNSLLASQTLSDKTRNHNFLLAVGQAFTEGISTYRGNISFGETQPEFYMELVCLRKKNLNTPQNIAACFILNSVQLNPVKQHEAFSGAEATTTSDFLNASVSLYTLDGTALYISPSVESLVGYTPEELKKMNYADVVFPDDLSIIYRVRDTLSPENDYLHAQYRVIHKNGAIVPLESSSYFIKAPPGRKAHIVNVTWDRSLHTIIKNALLQSEQKYYKLVMNLPTGIALINSNGQLAEVNTAMKDIMGLSTDMDATEINFFNIEAMRRYNIDTHLRRCISTKETVSGEVKLHVNSKSKSRFLTYSFVPVLNANNEVDLVIAYVSDLTQQLKAEIVSREQADFLNLAINTITSPFFVKDQDHRWVMLNDAAVEMMGNPREILIGKTDYDFYPKNQADTFWEYDQMALNSGSCVNEEQITWSDGRIHTILTHKQLYIEKSSGKKFIVGTIHDVSEYKRIEKELRASEKKYHELFDNANDFIITLDLEGNITNANRTLLNYLGMSLNEITRHNVFEYVDPAEMENARNVREKILSGSSHGVFEIQARSMQGTPVTYEVKASQIVHNETVTGVQCLFSDVTKRREATEKLQQYTQDLLDLNKTKDKFFSIIAHDLRNPSNSIIGFAEMLLEDLDQLSIEEIRDSLKIIHAAAKNSFTLLDNLLAWTRLETGHMPFKPEKLVLMKSIEDVTNVLFSLAYRKKIEINNLVSPDIVLFADKNMLNTILNNLIMNAIKYTTAGGNITISAEKLQSSETSEKHDIKISVADTGIGMDAGTLNSLFNANKVVSNPGTEKEQGTGLGLLLTREMVDKHGGSIKAESVPGKGSVFSFVLQAYRHDTHSV